MNQVIALKILESPGLEDANYSSCKYVGLNTKIAQAISEGYQPYAPFVLHTYQKTYHNGINQVVETGYNYTIEMAKYGKSE